MSKFPSGLPGLLTLFLTTLHCGCTFVPGAARPIRIIMIQPMAFDDPRGIAATQKDVASVFHCRVGVLAPAAMPLSFENLTKGERYSADSILAWLSRQKDDSVTILLGLTSKDIFIVEKDKEGRVREPASKYEVWGILGLGYCPGSTCIVSNARFRPCGDALYDHRLRTIVLHEIGHNLGLSHCASPHCIMNDAEGKISTVDHCGDSFCASCLGKLGL
jgi:archaemetzincin